jgi:hypothetical protein
LTLRGEPDRDDHNHGRPDAEFPLHAALARELVPGRIAALLGAAREIIAHGTSGEDSAVAPFFGAGYTGRLGRTGFYNMGLFVSPVELTTQTADSLTTGNGADVQLQLGIAF